MESISLTELSNVVSRTIGMAFPSTYWVRAEISELHVNRHAYFELVDKSESGGQISAKMRATCWSNIYSMLSAYFEQQTSRRLCVGMKVLLEVEVSYHNVYGMSLNICNIHPEYTIGDMARERQQTIERLRKDGTFEMQQSLSLPTLVKHVAVVSSSSAAGYEDFRHQLENSANVARVSCTLFAATMQGEAAAESIISALNKIYAEVDKFDAVVIVRGGGATTDLSCFDDYMLCSVCSQLPIPIISGIGHTRDVAVLDMVAFRSVKTPTAAAELFISHNDIQVQRVQQLRQRLSVLVANYSQRKRQRLSAIRQLFDVRRKHYLSARHRQLADYERTLSLLSPETLFRKGYTITTSKGKVVRSVAEIKSGDMIVTEWIDGTLESQVR